MRKLMEVLKEAQRKQVAVGHFNFFELAAFKAVVEAADKLKIPVMVGASEGERDFVGVRQIAIVGARAAMHPTLLVSDVTMRRLSTFRDRQPPPLVVWGKNDNIFPADGAHPYKRGLPEVEFHLIDTGHFALEDKADEIVPLIRDFVGRKVARR